MSLSRTPFGLFAQDAYDKDAVRSEIFTRNVQECATAQIRRSHRSVDLVRHALHCRKSRISESSNIESFEEFVKERKLWSTHGTHPSSGALSGTPPALKAVHRSAYSDLRAVIISQETVGPRREYLGNVYCDRSATR